MSGTVLKGVLFEIQLGSVEKVEYTEKFTFYTKISVKKTIQTVALFKNINYNNNWICLLLRRIYPFQKVHLLKLS